ncbi:uncharacterized protein LOC120339501 [Styela clava]
MKPKALIAIASGSSDVDVIVTSSVLSNLGVQVIIASADGWYPVTLQNGLVIKPTCSLERAFRSSNELFDLLLLPDGDDVSIGRLNTHPVLSSIVKAITEEPRHTELIKTDVVETNNNTWIITAGGSVRLLYTWNILTKCSEGGPKAILNFVKTWMITEAKGSKIVHNIPSNRQNVKIIMCSPAPENDPLRTVNACAAVARMCMIKCRKKEELSKYGNYTFSMIETYRKIELGRNVSENIRKILMKLTDNPRIPLIIRKFCLIPICAVVKSERPHAFNMGKLHPGKSCDYCEEAEVHSTKTTIDLLTKSSSYAVNIVWKFVQESLQLRKRPLTMCRAAILTANRVNEQLLAVLVHELRKKFKIPTDVIACDRSILKTRDPFITTHGMFQIRCDAAIETVRPCYDVIVVIDSEVDVRGPGMWYRKSTFNWDDFETIQKSGPPPYASCVTATFDRSRDGGKSALQSVNKQTKRKLNPLTNQYVTTEMMQQEDDYQPPIREATFFGVCSKRGQRKEGFFRERDCHDLVFQSFLPFHSKADMHTTVSSKTSAQDAVAFARAVTDCLSYLMAQRGQGSMAITNESRCCIL